jgi:MFS family permease
VQAANLPGNIISSLLVDRIGRKAVLSWSLVLACCAAAAFPFAHSEWSVLLCACLLNAASTCTWNALDVLSTEAFPTSLRATAMGVLAATGRVGSMSGQFVFGSLIHVSLFALLGVAACGGPPAGIPEAPGSINAAVLPDVASRKSSRPRACALKRRTPTHPGPGREALTRLNLAKVNPPTGVNHETDQDAARNGARGGARRGRPVAAHPPL